MTPASDRQLAFIANLLRDRDTDLVMADLDLTTSKSASTNIEWLLKLPVRPSAQAEAVTPGVFENEFGVFVVKPNREGTRVYAKKMVEIRGERLTESGDTVRIEFEYAPGAINRIAECDRMSVERAKELTLRYGRCINCARKLKDATSVERGIGPVCIKAFR